MKQVVLRIDDAAFEKFMGMVSLCPQVEVVNVCDTGDKKQTMDGYVASAIREMRQRLAFRSPCDYAYLMVAKPVKGQSPVIQPTPSMMVPTLFSSPPDVSATLLTSPIWCCFSALTRQVSSQARISASTVE